MISSMKILSLVWKNRALICGAKRSKLKKPSHKRTQITTCIIKHMKRISGDWVGVWRQSTPRGRRSLPCSSPINLSWKNPSERKGDRNGKVVAKLFFLSLLSVHFTSSQHMQNEPEKLLIFSNINVVFFSK